MADQKIDMFSMPPVEDVVAFEQGDMEDEELFVFFQRLINTGMAWKLQGFYGRTAMALINAGHCVTAEEYKNREGV